MAGLPRFTKGRGQIPDCEYWFAVNRQRQTEVFLLQHACWLGTLTVAVVYGIHIFDSECQCDKSTNVIYRSFAGGDFCVSFWTYLVDGCVSAPFLKTNGLE